MSVQVVNLHGNLDGNALCRLVQKFVDDCKGEHPKGVDINFSRLTFARPSGVTFLSNFVHWLNSREVQVTFSGLEARTGAVAFLDDSLFFEQHMGRKLAHYSAPRGTTKPLVQVRQQNSYAWLRQELIPWLAPTLGMTKASLGTLQACLLEIFNNIMDHSTKDTGSIFVQHFPNLKHVEISVADFGQGIPASVRQVKADLTDAEAIVLAVKSGFTTRSTPNNRGAGLDYLLNSVVIGNRGAVTIYSSKGHVMFSNKGNNVVARMLPSGGFCPGTTIDITLRTDTIEQLEEEPEDLEW